MKNNCKVKCADCNTGFQLKTSCEKQLTLLSEVRKTVGGTKYAEQRTVALLDPFDSTQRLKIVTLLELRDSCIHVVTVIDISDCGHDFTFVPTFSQLRVTKADGQDV